MVGSVLYGAWLCTGMTGSAGVDDRQFRRWGEDSLRAIQIRFQPAGSELYVEELHGKKPAFAWDLGVQLSALNAASSVDPRAHLPQLSRALGGLKRYWVKSHGIEGYDVLPYPKSVDRYYDDNAWLVICLLDAHRLKPDKGRLQQAKRTFDFVMTGFDRRLGGGVYWREKDRATKNTCSNAPVIVAALDLYQTTHQSRYLRIAKDLYAWINAKLQAPDGLFFDNIDLKGKIDRTEWSYNSALMIRANVMFQAVLGDRKFGVEASRIGRAAEAKWIDSRSGAFRDAACFAHLLCESFLFLGVADKDPRWSRVVTRGLAALHVTATPDNLYGKRWDGPPKHGEPPALLEQASAARAYFVAAALAKG